MNRSMLADFANPDAEYRGAPFWAWNGTLEPGECRRQIRLMKRMGFGGFFMHSRVGLATPYLQPEWFDCVGACIDEAEKQGMKAWLYDEDRWPSGAAGGWVTRCPEYRCRHLAIRMLPPGTRITRAPNTLAVFVARIDGVVARDVRLIPPGKSPAATEGEVILRCDVDLEPPSNWFNGQTYLDTMNPKAVREFIRVTHDVYRKRYGANFGRQIPGIFTDEPEHRSVMGEVRGDDHFLRHAWTDRLPAEFRKRYGYDLIPHLLELAFDVEGNPVSQARYHYHDCTTRLFTEAFARQIGDWCDRHGLLFTGHVLSEETLRTQADRVGVCMRFYESMQAPGMDMLSENGRVFATAKQVSSVANQFGRKWRLTETYGCTGWDFSFAGHKALGDWQAALGINLRCQHLAWYTMRGEAKRDYPASIFYQSPWWDLYGKVEDYFARIHSVMTRGREVRDLLVIHPVESAWVTTRRDLGLYPDREQLDLDFLKTTDVLLGAHLDFDYGDEEMMSRHARVVWKKGAVGLQLGKAVYRCVLVPSQITLRRTTLTLLRKFRAAGGTVIFAGRQATFMDAIPSPEILRFAGEGASVPGAGPDLIRMLEPVTRRVSITDADGVEIAAVLYLLREDQDNYYLFICNTGEDFVAGGKPNIFTAPVRGRCLAFPDVRVRGLGDAAGHPVELNPETGTSGVANAERGPEGWTIRTHLPPLGSRLYTVPKKAGKSPVAPVLPLHTVRAETLNPDRWKIRLSESNVLVLDRCAFRIGRGEWRPETEILRVDDEVRVALGVEARGGAMVQPWARRVTGKPRTSPLSLVYTFWVDHAPSGDLFLAIEEPEVYAITLNGQCVSAEPESGWWVDRSLRKVRVNPSGMKPGMNTLRLDLLYSEAFSGLEIIYLLGDFGVRVEGATVRLTAHPSDLALGDWCQQNLPFYAGHVTYYTMLQPRVAEGERIFVCVPDYRGMGVRVMVNGESAGVIGWEPNELEITRLVGDAPLELAFEVLGHRRNSHGPFHIDAKWPEFTGPGEFKYDAGRWFDGYQLVPCGLMAPPRIEYRRV